MRHRFPRSLAVVVIISALVPLPRLLNAQTFIPVPSGAPKKANPGDVWVLSKVEMFPKTGSATQPGARGGSARYVRNIHTGINRTASRVIQEFVGKHDKKLLGKYTFDFSWAPLPKSFKAGDRIPVSARGRLTVNKAYPGRLASVTFGIVGRGHPHGVTFQHTRKHVMSLSTRNPAGTITSQLIVPKNPPNEVKIMTGGAGAKIFWYYTRNGKPAPVKPRPAPVARATPKANVLMLHALDANPKFNSKEGVMPEELKPTQAILGKTKRKGTCADGVSQLIIRAEVNKNTPVAFTLADKSRGKLTSMFGGRTMTLQKRHYAFALYTPPARFGGGTLKKTPESVMSPAAIPKLRLGKVLEVEDLMVIATPYEIDSRGRGTPVRAGRLGLPLKLARPPVVLVHGLFSNPVDCWVKTKDTGASFVILLERLGFLPFLVNYQQSNGTEPQHDPTTSKRNRPRTSSFADNTQVVWKSPDPYVPEVTWSQWFSKLLPSEKPIYTPLQAPKNLRIGGISEAVTYYRNTLGIAATQADVIGHSMGGILARVWASTEYNPLYERDENFYKGDIRRLITLNTPHHGSELAELKDAIEKANIKGESWRNWAARTLTPVPGWWYTNAPAIRDLRAGSRALRRIGPTKIPSFAVCTWAEDSILGNNDFDEADMYLNLYTVAGLMFFHNNALLEDFVNARFLRWRNTAKPFKKFTDFEGRDATHFNRAEAQREYKRIFMSNMDHNVYFWASRRERAYWNELKETVKNTTVIPYGILHSDMGQSDMEMFVSTAKSLTAGLLTSYSVWATGGDATRATNLEKEQDAPTEFMSQLRALVFHNDHKNDGAVRVVSQQGGLPANEVIRGVLHSFSPWDYRVQRRLLALLKWEDHKFSSHGFGAAGQLTPRYLPSSRFKEARVYGHRAVRWSGYVPSHAREYGKIADKKHVIILGRPVNHDSTKLIMEGAATKAMAVKGKSASWGPQRGFIPVNQRFSKIWRVNASDPSLREKNIKKFSAVTQKMLKKEHPVQTGKFYAEAVPLSITIAGKKYDVLYHPDADDLSKKSDADAAIVLHKDGKFYDWRNDGGKRFSRENTPKGLSPQPSPDLAATYKNSPMKVLADGLSEEDPKPYLTADYDLLAIGYHRVDGFQGPPKEVAEADFHPIYGAVSARQIDLIKALNHAVKKGAGYKSGNVTHHGPENQYSGSPYIDYPILVFDPGGEEQGDQEIFIIRQGPIGFRDIHLKRYFTEKIRQGFNLWANPKGIGWLWRKSSTFPQDKSYDPRDHEKLDKYVAEAPEPTDARGNQNSEGAQRPPDTSHAQKRDDLPGKMKEADQPKKPQQPGKDKEMADGPKKKEPNQQDPDVMQAPRVKSKFDGLQTKEIRNLANRGDTAAMNEIGYRYSIGLGVPKDPAVAMQWLNLSAERGDKAAPLMIARHYISRDNPQPDPVQAMHWYQKAATDGHAEGHNGIGYIHMNGLGTPKNARLAVEHYKKAAALNYPYALNNLGSCYLKGMGVKKDVQKSIQYYEKSAALGNLLAHRNLGLMYVEGSSVKQDLTKAASWFKKSARLGDDQAANQLGILYEKGGGGLRKDLTKALTYFKQAAKGGNIYAQYNVGNYTASGKGTAKDLVEAYAWLHLSANNGFLRAGRERDRLEKHMTGPQVRAALLRYRELKEK